MNTLCENISGESYVWGEESKFHLFLLLLIYTQMDYKFLRMLHW